MNIIPQVFYDLIARIMPSTGFLLLTYLPFIVGLDTQAFSKHLRLLKTDGLNIDENLNFGTFSIILLLIYILGLILKTPSERISNSVRLRKMFFSIDKQEKAIIDAEKEKLMKLNENYLPEYWKMLSLVRIKAPEEGHRLLKMIAETRMCEILIFGLLTSFLINVILIFSSNSSILFRIGYGLMMLLFTKSLFHVKQSINDNFAKGLLSTWSIIKGLY